MATKITKKAVVKPEPVKPVKAVASTTAKKVTEPQIITQRSKFADTTSLSSYAKNKSILNNEKPTVANLNKYAVNALKNSTKDKNGFYKLRPSKTSESDELSVYSASNSPSRSSTARNPANLPNSNSGLTKKTKK